MHPAWLCSSPSKAVPSLWPGRVHHKTDEISQLDFDTPHCWVAFQHVDTTQQINWNTYVDIKSVICNI